MNHGRPQTARSFFDFSEATATVLDLLEKQMPDCAVFVAYHDDNAKLLRIVDFRGVDRFGIHSGQTMALLQDLKSGHRGVVAATASIAGAMSKLG